MLARELADGFVDPSSACDVYEAAVYSAASLAHDPELTSRLPEGEALNREAAGILLATLSHHPALRAMHHLSYPQAIISTDPVTTLRPPRLFNDPRLLGKPGGALWTSSFLAPDAPAWSAMRVNDHFAPGRALRGIEFLRPQRCQRLHHQPGQ